MAPNIIGNSFILAETTIEPNNANSTRILSAKNDTSLHEIHKTNHATKGLFSFSTSDIVWRNVIAFLYLHIAASYGVYLLATGRAQLLTFGIAYVYGALGGFGITAGAHRLWAHKAYKAKWQLRLILMIFNTISFQNSIYEWVRDHRVHHKFCDSNADPHNVQRGFFFSHMGWLLLKKHPDVKSKGASIDMSDLKQDEIVMFQRRHYLKIMPIFCFVIPTLIPMFMLNESLSGSFYVGAILRYVITLHSTWLVNSAAHMWGMRPYDKNIRSANNIFVSMVSYGEGWHNYHHVFPWDYKTAELGDYRYNFSTAFIDFFAKFGWAYELKTVSDDMIRKRAARTGDGSNKYSRCIKNGVVRKEDLEHHDDDSMVWGWDDKDMNDEDKEDALIIKKTE